MFEKISEIVGIRWFRTNLQYAMSYYYSMKSSENGEKGNTDKDEAQNILVISFATLFITCPFSTSVFTPPQKEIFVLLMHTALRNQTPYKQHA